ncbi:MAG: hypothetical protein ACXWWC_06770 [Chitinophagaceae bacterium]
MINILITNRIFAIAIAAAITTAVSSPALANDEKDTIPAGLKYEGTNIAGNFILDKDVANNSTIRSKFSGRKNNRKVVAVDFSWYKPEPPEDINPYDKIQLDFSWYKAEKPLDINPYTDKI